MAELKIGYAPPNVLNPPSHDIKYSTDNLQSAEPLCNVLFQIFAKFSKY